MASEGDLPIIQRTYDLLVWYVPRLNKFPRSFKFVLGDQIQASLYAVLDGLIRARYRQDKLGLLEEVNAELDILRYKTRLSKDFNLLDVRRYEYVSKRINEIGKDLGAWIKHQRRVE